MPPGLKASSDFAKKKSWSENRSPLCSSFTSANGGLPMTASRSLGEPRVPETLDADLVLRVKGPGDSPGERIELDADEVHPLGSEPKKVAAAAPGLKHGGVRGNAEPFDGLEHRPDHRGRGVEGIEHGAFAHWRIPRARGAPCSSSPRPARRALVGPVTGSGKSERATAPNPPKRASVCRSSDVAGRPLRTRCV